MEDQPFIVLVVKNKMKLLTIIKFYLLLSFSVAAEEFVYGLDDIPSLPGDEICGKLECAF